MTKPSLDKEKFVVGDETYDPYALDKMKKVPTFLKVGFLKFWASGATYYFVGLGLGAHLPSVYDQLVITGLILGLVMEYIINKVIGYMDNPETPTNRYRLVKTNQVKALFINLLWGLTLTTIIIFTYELLNLAALKITGSSPEKVLLPAGPVGFGILYLFYETLMLILVNPLRKEKHHE